MESENCPKKKDSCAEELVYMLESINRRFDSVADSLTSKLSPIMREAFPEAEIRGTLEKAPRQFPPLFETMRNNILALERTAERILNCIDRTEL